MPDSLVQIFLGRNIQVFDLSALQTYEVIMLINERVVPPRGFTKIELPNFTLLLEDVQISIHCSQRYVGHLFPHAFVHPLSGRM